MQLVQDLVKWFRSLHGTGVHVFDATYFKEWEGALLIIDNNSRGGETQGWGKGQGSRGWPQIVNYTQEYVWFLAAQLPDNKAKK